MSVIYFSDCKYIVSGSADNSICIQNAETGGGYIHTVMAVAYSSYNKHIVSGSDENTICVWDVETGNMSCELLKGHNGHVYSMAWHTHLIASILSLVQETRQSTSGILK